MARRCFGRDHHHQRRADRDASPESVSVALLDSRGQIEKCRDNVFCSGKISCERRRHQCGAEDSDTARRSAGSGEGGV